MKLVNLKIHQRAVIKEVNLSEEHTRRLFHLGLFPGAIIRMERIAPLKDPLEFYVCGNLIILRKADAACIEVNEEENP